MVAREAGPLAEVLATGRAVAAVAVRPPEPGDAEPLAGRDVGSDDLVPEHERELRIGELAVEDVQVGTADAAGLDAQEHLARRGLGVGKVAEPERPAGRVEDHRLHRTIVAAGDES